MASDIEKLQLPEVPNPGSAERPRPRAPSVDYRWDSRWSGSIWYRGLLRIQRVSFFLDHSRMGRVWDLFDTALNLVQVALFIGATTVVNSSAEPIPLPLYHRIPGLVITIALLVQFLIRHLLITGDYFTWYMLVTLFDTIPALAANCLSFVNDGFYNSYLSAGVLVIFYPVRFLRLQMSLTQLLTPGQSSIVRLSPFKRKVLLLVSNVAMTLLTVAAILHTLLHHFYREEIQALAKEFNYFDAFFYCSVSITAGPADDVIPDLLVTRLVVMMILVLAALFLPGPIGDLVDLMRGISQYSSYTPDPRSNHVILCGSLDNMAISEFLLEFYNVDHGYRIMHTSVVIVHTDEPDDELEGLLNDPMYATRVQYYLGSPTSYSVLETVRAREAKAVFILTCKYSRRPRIDEDAETVMRALAISSYTSIPLYEAAVRHELDPWRYLPPEWPGGNRSPLIGPSSRASQSQVRIYAQIILPETETHFRNLHNTRILAVEEFRMGILAQSCATAGFSTLLHLLTTTVTDKAVHRTLRDLRSQVTPTELAWMSTYLEGATQEIYETKFPRSLVGQPYKTVAQILYRNYGVVLFAVGVCRRRPRNPHRESEFHEVYLNPNNHTIRPRDLAFVIAHSSEQVEAIGKYMDPTMSPSSLFSRVFAPAPDTMMGYEAVVPPPTSPMLAEPPMPVGNEIAPESLEAGDLLEAETAPESEGILPAVLPFFTALRQQPPPPPTNITISPVLLPKAMPMALGEPESDPAAPIMVLSPNFEIRRKLDLKTRRAVKEGLNQRIRQRKRRILLQNNPFTKDLADHIVICDASSSFPRHIEYLVQSLKTAFSNDALPIVILCPSNPPRVQSLTLKDFQNVYVVEGTPLSSQDLARTYVERARGVIVLSNAKHYASATKRLIDSSAVLAEINIRSRRSIRRRPCFSVLEMVHRHNIKYLDGETPLKSTDPLASQLLQPSFASGNVFLPTMLDVMMCHSYFNPHILDIYKHLIFSNDHFTTPQPTTAPEMVQGREVTPSTTTYSIQLPPTQASIPPSTNGNPDTTSRAVVVPPPLSAHTSSASFDSSSPSSSSLSPPGSDSGVDSKQLVRRVSTESIGPNVLLPNITEEPADISTVPVESRPSSKGRLTSPSSSAPTSRPRPRTNANLGYHPVSVHSSPYLRPTCPEIPSDGPSHTERDSLEPGEALPPELVQAQAEAGRPKRRISRGRIFLVSLPPAYIDVLKVYGELYLDLLEAHEAVAIGLYRSVARNYGTPFKCVFTNPPAGTALRVNDQVYVIAQQKPQWPLGSYNANTRRGSLQPNNPLNGPGGVPVGGGIPLSPLNPTAPNSQRTGGAKGIQRPTADDGMGPGQGHHKPTPPPPPPRPAHIPIFFAPPDLRIDGNRIPGPGPPGHVPRMDKLRQRFSRTRTGGSDFLPQPPRGKRPAHSTASQPDSNSQTLGLDTLFGSDSEISDYSTMASTSYSYSTLPSYAQPTVEKLRLADLDQIYRLNSLILEPLASHPQSVRTTDPRANRSTPGFTQGHRYESTGGGNTPLPLRSPPMQRPKPRPSPKYKPPAQSVYAKAMAPTDPTAKARYSERHRQFASIDPPPYPEFGRAGNVGSPRVASLQDGGNSPDSGRLRRSAADINSIRGSMYDVSDSESEADIRVDADVPPLRLGH
ncbi:hypothetical protein H4R33_001173 [Dimargaris cristalligena]|nr:hypothetical protein H4R33_001173 [Dimargaris cristalligena]